MQQEFDLHPLAVEDARSGHQRPKIEEYGNCLFAVLHIVEPMDGEFRVGEVAIFTGPNYVLSGKSGEGTAKDHGRTPPPLVAGGPTFGLAMPEGLVRYGVSCRGG